MYAILDLETTGLHRNDRVVEIAVVHAGETGAVTGMWHTLVNPERDLGPVHIHGIRAGDARRAPLFGDIAGTIADKLDGRIPVAHNIGFDSSMLGNEFARLGLDAPNLAEYGVCTMAWASEFLGPKVRSLRHCCEVAGIGNDRPHEALSDALATTQLLAHYLADCGQAPAPWVELRSTARDMEWLKLESTAHEAHRGAGSAPVDLLSLLPNQRTTEPDTRALRRYMNALDRALVDHELSTSQAEELVSLATQEGISVQYAADWHAKYLHIRANHEKAVHAQSEMYPRLTALATALGLDSNGLDNLLHTPPPALPFKFAPFTLQRNDITVLTGSFDAGKDHWAQVFSGAGLAVADYVTKQTALVVAADPDTMSHKARTARRYGIPVVRPDGAKRLAQRL